uniref:Uncharacterized protein n=1 Tax=Ignisphaera aggregans TaxID=334771 RepID=A0A7J2T9Q9_9CREN
MLDAYPGEAVRLGVNVRGPRDHVVKVEVRELPSDIAVVTVTPEESPAPFTSTIAVSVSASAPLGNYLFELVVYDATGERLLGTDPLVLLVLGRGLSRDFAKHYSKLCELYAEYEAMATIWHLLKHVLPSGATFTQLKQAYQLFVGKKVSIGIIGNTPKRMLGKKIIAEEQPGLYIANVKDFDIVLSRIDIAQVRVCTSVRAGECGESESAEQIARGVQRRRGQSRPQQPPKYHRASVGGAQEIAKEHSTLATFYILLHTWVLRQRATYSTGSTSGS